MGFQPSAPPTCHLWLSWALMSPVSWWDRACSEAPVGSWAGRGAVRGYTARPCLGHREDRVGGPRGDPAQARGRRGGGAGLGDLPLCVPSGHVAPRQGVHPGDCATHLVPGTQFLWRHLLSLSPGPGGQTSPLCLQQVRCPACPGCGSCFWPGCWAPAQAWSDPPLYLHSMHLPLSPSSSLPRPLI